MTHSDILLWSPKYYNITKLIQIKSIQEIRNRTAQPLGTLLPCWKTKSVLLKTSEKLWRCIL